MEQQSEKYNLLRWPILEMYFGNSVEYLQVILLLIGAFR